ncbi:uncharacterized protein OCT59_021619 [Rhizophagus irregularis]|nr:hypothetical protein OCT59_021619 [Rhizophagus irregularis]
MKHEGLYISIFGYLNHLEDCQSCLPPPLRINETVKLMAQNLLQINVHPSHILDENKYMIKENIYPLSPTKKQ